MLAIGVAQIVHPQLAQADTIACLLECRFVLSFHAPACIGGMPSLTTDWYVKTNLPFTYRRRCTMAYAGFRALSIDRKLHSV